jgi:recombination protein RecT
VYANSEASPAGVTVAEAERSRMVQLTGLVAERQAQLAALLGTDEAGVDRFVTVALQTVQGNPKLLKCSALSLLGAIRDAATYGLEPAGILGDAAIVPYRNPDGTYTASLQIEYRGLRKLALRDGRVAAIDADLVYTRDTFRIISGDRPAILHEPSLEADRGEYLGAYAWARFANGELVYLWLPLAEILKRRDASRAWRDAERDGSNDSIWHLWFPEQAKKTALRRFVLEKLPMSPLEREALAVDTLADTNPVQAAQALARVMPAGSEARARLLERMHLNEPAAQLEPGDTTGGPESGTADGPPDTPEAQGVQDAPQPAEGALCGAPNPWRAEGSPDACSKPLGHVAAGDPMHRGAEGETWQDQ